MGMTNEELVELIRLGDIGLLPELWEQVRRFIAMMARRHYEKSEDKGGCELDDLIQAGYFGLLAAIRYYKPAKGFKFITYLDLSLKNAFNEAMGIRKRDWLNYSASLDMPVGEGDDTALIDMLGDMTPGTADVEETIVEDIFNQELRLALNDALKILSKQQKNIIELHYYFGQSITQIAESKGTSRQYIYYLHDEALWRIYNSRHRGILEKFVTCSDKLPNPYRKTGFRYWEETGNSSAEAFLLHNDNYSRMRKNAYDK